MGGGIWIEGPGAAVPGGGGSMRVGVGADDAPALGLGTADPCPVALGIPTEGAAELGGLGLALAPGVLLAGAGPGLDSTDSSPRSTRTTSSAMAPTPIAVWLVTRFMPRRV